MNADPRSKFQIDVLANVVGMGVLGISGIVLNSLIARKFGTDALGVFNQVLATYVIFSQLAVFGVQLAVTRHLPDVLSDRSTQKLVVTAALIVVFSTALITTCLFLLGRGMVAAWFESPNVGVGIVWAAPGLFLFAINKVMMGVLNGQRRMRLFAVCQGGRGLLALLGLVFFASYGFESTALPVVLSVSELGVFLFLVPFTVRFVTLRDLAQLGAWMKKLAAFGAKSFPSGTLIELNTRVDVMILGFFSTDHVVGIYSFAAVLVEGVFQLLIVLRSNYTPLLGPLLAEDRRDELLAIVKRGKRVALMLTVGSGIVSILLYPSIVRLISGDAALSAESWPVFTILIAGLAVASPVQPFYGILLQAGLPGWYSCMMAASVVINSIVNAALIPAYGLLGAAVATGFSFVASAWVFKLFARRLIHIPM